MKLFFSQSDILEPVHRSYLSEWVKPLFPEPRHSIYGLDSKDLEYCKEQSDADAFLLPFNWNYYFEKGEIQHALDLINDYKRWDKPIYTWVGGDYTYKVPEGDFILFRQNGYHSARRKDEHAFPVIIRDPMEYLNLAKITVLKKETKPKIGFCGLTDKNWLVGNLRKVKTSIFKLRNAISKPYLDLNYPISGTAFRGEVLRILSNSNVVETDFIIRYSSGGQNTNSNKYKLEFWQNMLTSPYILCVRGAGNYSARFYEALALGRIPVFVNTDCILPLDDKIDWKQHCIWVEDYDLDNIINIIEIFHSKISEAEFISLQNLNRQLWKEKLTYDGFYKSFRKMNET